MDAAFLRNEMLWGPAAQQRLQRAHVIVFGLGGVGGWCAECLCRSGVGELTLVDGDTVAASNLNRQVEALRSTLGQPKAAALAARLRDISPDAAIHPIAAVYDAAHRADFFPEVCRYDFIVDAIDLVTHKLDLALTARERGIPLVMALGTGNKLDPAQLRLADLSETHGDPLARVVRKELRRRGVEHLPVVFSPEPPAVPEPLEPPPEGRRSAVASSPWVPAAAGLLLASFVVRELIKEA